MELIDICMFVICTLIVLLSIPAYMFLANLMTAVEYQAKGKVFGILEA